MKLLTVFSSSRPFSAFKRIADKEGCVRHSFSEGGKVSFAKASATKDGKKCSIFNKHSY